MPRATHQRHALAAIIALTLMAMTAVSKVLGPRQLAHSVASAPPPPDETTWRASAARGEAFELSLRDDLRKQCSEYALPPEPYALESVSGTDADAAVLEGLSRCLREGPLAGQIVELLGPTELPGTVEHAVESDAPADAVRSLLARSGVPFQALVTRDVALDPSATAHGSLRVVLGLAPEPQEP